jgi:hypothetical protein
MHMMAVGIAAVFPKMRGLEHRQQIMAINNSKGISIQQTGNPFR